MNCEERKVVYMVIFANRKKKKRKKNGVLCVKMLLVNSKTLLNGNQK